MWPDIPVSLTSELFKKLLAIALAFIYMAFTIALPCIQLCLLFILLIKKH